MKGKSKLKHLSYGYLKSLCQSLYVDYHVSRHCCIDYFKVDWKYNDYVCIVAPDGMRNYFDSDVLSYFCQKLGALGLTFRIEILDGVVTLSICRYYPE